MDYRLEIQAIAKKLLEEGAVKWVIGYEKAYDNYVTPCFVDNTKEVSKLIWNEFCIHNLSRYLLELDGKKAIIAKGCDVPSIIELIKFNQITREDVYIIGISCDGIVNIKLAEKEGKYKLENYEKKKYLYSKCKSCPQPVPHEYDTLIGEKNKVGGEKDFSEVEEIESKAPEERIKLWKKWFKNCIRCYACRNVCPLCFCKECLHDKFPPIWVSKYSKDSDAITFQLIRAFHAIGRCTGCGECERVCPMGIPLSKLYKKVEKDVKDMFGYVAGVNASDIPPLATFEQEESDNVLNCISG
jgi:ferredoxin